LSVSNILCIARIIFSVVFTCLWIVPALFAGQGEDKLDFNGDFRYRYELIDLSDDNHDVRTRHRIRARFGLLANVADEVSVVLQIATGSDDPVSSNQSLSGTFSSKNIVFDLAYGEYQPAALNRRVTIIAGKSILPFFRPSESKLLWDSDLRPEGISARFNLGNSEVDLKLLGGYYILEERVNDANSNLLAGQIVGTNRTFPGLSSLKVGIGYFHFTEIQGRAPFFRDDFFGNSFFADTTLPANPTDPPEITLKHEHDYREVELFMEAGFSWRERPILLMADYVVNTKPETDNTGWLMGVKVGDVTKIGAWSIRYNFRRLEADAVFGTFADSNFGGGGTNGKGHDVGFSFGAFKNTKLSLSYFHNWVGVDSGDKYQRWIMDVTSTF